MKAYLYDIKRYYLGEQYPIEGEFIVISNDDKKRDGEANRILNWYAENSKKQLHKSVLGSPQLVESILIHECSKSQIDWEDIQQCQLKQNESRPREIGCIFRGGAPAPESGESLSKEETLELKESIEYFMEEHRNSGKSFLFVGSRWELETRLRFGNITLIEACGIELASDIAQLEFFSQKLETIYINWCCPIYIV